MLPPAMSPHAPRLALAASASALALLVTPSDAVAQASRFLYQPPPFQIVTEGAPSTLVESIPVTAEGRIADFSWWFTFPGAGNLRFRYALPDGTYFEQVMDEPAASTDHVFGKPALGTWTLRLTESLPNQSYAFSTGFSVVAIRDARTDLPVTGSAAPALAGADSIVTDWMRSHEIEAATLAVMKNGKLVGSRGYGWQDRARTTPASPDAVSRWASNTKALTAAAIRILVAQGKLALSDKAWNVLAVPPPAGRTVTDPRHYQYTIDELLHHRAGVVRDVVHQSGTLGAELGLGRAATLTEMVAFMWTVDLAYDPNPDPQGEEHYSNWGYQLLGAIIEKVSGTSYEDFVRDRVTGPLGASTFRVGRRGPGRALPGELWYAGRSFVRPDWDYDDSLELVEDPYGDDLETRPGAGSLVSCAPDYLRFLKAYFHTGEPKPSSLVDWSWSYTFYGAGPGNTSITRDHVWPDGSTLAWAVLINEWPADQNAVDDLRERLDTFFAGVTQWPTADLFDAGPCMPPSLPDAGPPDASAFDGPVSDATLDADRPEARRDGGLDAAAPDARGDGGPGTGGAIATGGAGGGGGQGGGAGGAMADGGTAGAPGAGGAGGASGGAAGGVAGSCGTGGVTSSGGTGAGGAGGTLPGDGSPDHPRPGDAAGDAPGDARLDARDAATDPSLRRDVADVGRADAAPPPPAEGDGGGGCGCGLGGKGASRGGWAVLGFLAVAIWRRRRPRSPEPGALVPARDRP